jgi:ABC-type thiamine transport system substrate-binding protein
MNIDDLEAGKFPDHGFGNFSSGNQSVFGIAIDKYIEFLLGSEVRRDIASRQEDFPQFAAVQIEARLGCSHDGKDVSFTKDCHAPINI